MSAEATTAQECPILHRPCACPPAMLCEIADATPTLTEGLKHCPVTQSPCYCQGSYCRMTGQHLEAADFRTVDATPTLTADVDAEYEAMRIKSEVFDALAALPVITITMDEYERLQADSRAYAQLRYGLTELERALLALTREGHDFIDRCDGVLALLRRVAGAGE